MSGDRYTDNLAGKSALLAVLVVVTALSQACGPGPKGPLLLEFEALRATNYTRNIRLDADSVQNPVIREDRERASGAISESDQWYTAAIAAWEEREDDRAEELARQGVLMYRAAEAYSRAADARERIETANATAQFQRERRNRYNDMVQANEEVIQLLLALRALYNETESCRADAAAATLEAQSRDNSVWAILDAQAALRDAQNHNADRFAPTVFNEGQRLLADAQRYSTGMQYQASFDTATSATSRFRQAVMQSSGEVQDIRARFLRSSAQRGLYDEAVALYGDDATIDARGLVIVFPNMFAERRSEARSERSYQLDQLANILRDVSRQRIQIEGHTSDSGATEANLAVSQARAEAVRDFLLRSDINSRRMTTVGLGEAFPRFDNRTQAGRENNNRVEIVLPFE